MLFSWDFVQSLYNLAGVLKGAKELGVSKIPL